MCIVTKFKYINLPIQISRFVPVVYMDFFSLSSRFVPDKGFAGADRTARQEGPVPFQRDDVEEDPFNLNVFLTEAKKANKRPAEDSRSNRDYDKGKKRRE